MATRRASWSRALVVHREDASAVRHENDENVNPMLSFEHEDMVRERHVLVGCYARLHPRIPLRDISHLFPGSGNVAPLENKANMSPPVQQTTGNRPVRRPLPSAWSQNPRKRRQPESTSVAPAVRRVLPKFR